MDRFGGSVSNILHPMDGKIGGYWGLFGSILSLCVELILKYLEDPMGWLARQVQLRNSVGPVWYTIYHHLPVAKGVFTITHPSIHQTTNGKRTYMEFIV